MGKQDEESKYKKEVTVYEVDTGKKQIVTPLKAKFLLNSEKAVLEKPKAAAKKPAAKS